LEKVGFDSKKVLSMESEAKVHLSEEPIQLYTNLDNDEGIKEESKKKKLLRLK
jgi:hypothetical protein